MRDCIKAQFSAATFLLLAATYFTISQSCTMISRISDSFRLPSVLRIWCRAAVSICQSLLNLFIFDLLRHVYERVMYVVTRACTRFEECHVVLPSECLPLFCRYDFFVKHVSLVANQYLFNILARVQLNLSDPIAHIVETILRRAIIRKNNAHCSLVVGLGYRSETFLARSVPNLQLHILAIYLDCLDLKVDSYKEKNIIVILIDSKCL